MKPLKRYEVTMSERIHTRVTVEAPCERDAEAIAAKTVHMECFKAMESAEFVSEILEFEGPDWVEVEAVP